MRKSGPAIFILVVAFIVNAWGNVIAAAFCPRYASNHDCCVRRFAAPPEANAEKPSCHHEMAGMNMDDEMDGQTEDVSAQSLMAPLADITSSFQTVAASETSEDESVFDVPIQPCPHCLSHSPQAPATANIGNLDSSKRTAESTATIAHFVVAFSSTPEDRQLPSEHGPPGNGFPRHVLINIFRI
jgi:hypothetical protein